jgi:hypothetical protein
MSGILFCNTQDLDQIRMFYQAKIGMSLWLEQGDCLVLKHGNLMVGFCKGEGEPFGGIITFFYETKEEVDEVYHDLEPAADNSPRIKDELKIYHFFAKDPDGRKLEFQSFLHPLEPYFTGEELLLAKKNVHRFENKAVPKDVLRKIFSFCRFPSSTSMATPTTFSIIQSEEKRNELIKHFKRVNVTVHTAPCIVMISSERKTNDDTLKQILFSTYHFSLVARLHGLGTEIIEDFDREKVKNLLDLTEDDHVVLAILLGYPFAGVGSFDESRLSNRVCFID